MIFPQKRRRQAVKYRRLRESWEEAHRKAAEQNREAMRRMLDVGHAELAVPIQDIESLEPASL